MTQQIIAPQEKVSIAGCRTCGNFRNAFVFEVCTHEQSHYKIGAEEGLHTCQHMRASSGKCGPEARLRRR